MAVSLVIKHSGLPLHMKKPWALVLRTHDMSGTDYKRIAILDDAEAYEVADSGHGITFLYGDPRSEKP
jgi:hypothetical protein